MTNFALGFLFAIVFREKLLPFLKKYLEAKKQRELEEEKKLFQN